MSAQTEAGLTDQTIVPAGAQRGECAAAGGVVEDQVWNDLLEGWVKLCLAAQAGFQMCCKRGFEIFGTPTSSKSSGSSGSSGSGSKSSGSSGTSTKRFVASGTGYAEAYVGKLTSVTYNGETYIKASNSNYWYKRSDAQRIDGGRTYYWKTGTTKYVKKYLEGGVADATGLAWLDGTKHKPERILSPYQTQLFEDMVKSLHAIRTLRVPASTVIPALPEARQTQALNIENITVQVQRLESDQDYEEMAERVGEEIMEKITRGMTVGGIRIG